MLKRVNTVWHIKNLNTVSRERHKILRNRERLSYSFRNYNLLRSKLDRQFFRLRTPLNEKNAQRTAEDIPKFPQERSQRTNVRRRHLQNVIL